MDRRPIKVERYKLPAGVIRGTVKLGIFSDLHADKHTNWEEVFATLRKFQNNPPDYLLVLGDMIDGNEFLTNHEFCERLKRFFEGLAKIAPTIVVLGNHDQRKSDEAGITAWPCEPEKYISLLRGIRNLHLLMDGVYEDERIYVAGHYAPPKCYGEDRVIDRTKVNVTKSERLGYSKDRLAGFVDNLTVPSNKPSVLAIHSARCLKTREAKLIVEDFSVVVSGHQHNWGMPRKLFDLGLSFYGLGWPNSRIFVASPFRTFRFEKLEKRYTPKISFLELT